jgi:large subunit ribosomal protein L3
MLPIWDQWGRKHAATVLQLDECQVVQVKTEGVEGYNAVQLGVGEAKRKNTTKPLLKHFEKAGVNSKRELKEFRVSRDALLPVGTLISSGHFVPGQKVDVQGVRCCAPPFYF